jgi:hypothetical protein
LYDESRISKVQGFDGSCGGVLMMKEDEVGDAPMVRIIRNLLSEEVNDFKAVSNDGKRALMLEILVSTSSMVFSSVMMLRLRAAKLPPPKGNTEPLDLVM